MKIDPKKPPKYLSPKFEQIPAELKELPNWLIWCPKWNGSKWTKRPIQLSGFGASTTNPKHWCSFKDVREAYKCAVDRGYIVVREKDEPPRRVSVFGVGFVFDGRPDENGLVLGGVDFDAAIKNGSISLFSRKCIKRLKSYAELSVSGEGLHGISLVRPLERGINHNHVEMYTQDHFFTMTGQAKNVRRNSGRIASCASGGKIERSRSFR